MADISPADEAPRRRFLPGAARAVLWLAALGALLLSGFTAWRLESSAPAEAEISRLDARLDTLAAAQAALEREDAETRDRLEAREAASNALAARLDGARAALAQALAAADGPPAPAEWKLAEVEYLLRVANSRLAMERDVEGAGNLLAGADAILAELGDFAYHEVRGLLAEERLALGGYRGADTQGAYLRLEAMKALLDSLPLRLPAYIGRGDDAVPASDEAGSEAAEGSSMRGVNPSRSPAEGSSMRGANPSRSPAEGSSMRGVDPSRSPAEGPSRSPAEGSFMRGVDPSRSPAEGSSMRGVNPLALPG